MTEDGMVGWHHRFNEHEFEQAVQGDCVSGMLQSMRSQKDEHD